jgi:predicted lipase
MTDKQYWYLTQNWEHYSIEYGVKTLESIESRITGAFCWCGEKDNELILCFRGTRLYWRDILADILFKKSVIPYSGTNPKIKVHFGFLERYKSIRNKLYEFLLYNRAGEYNNINIIGHSLGGATATLCILDLQYNSPIWDCSFYKEGKSHLSSTIFGTPRVGNRYFKRSFNGRIQTLKSYTNVNDLVTKLPLVVMGFRHIKERIKVGKLKFPFISIKAHITYDEYL